MARKKVQPSDGLPTAEVPVPGSPSVVVELVDQARAAMSGACESYGERNSSDPTDAFRERIFAEWYANAAGRIREAFRADVLG